VAPTGRVLVAVRLTVYVVRAATADLVLVALPLAVNEERGVKTDRDRVLVAVARLAVRVMVLVLVGEGCL